ncbi:MAG TPA: class I SAM-dependent methyltransferase [Planctomycetaceae bacterium]|jgi:ubiquinone/menaquinone biosynthesis C-methylase UbiE|nr:class I SAM-dependent methyltransferase [Planctomycetaceae bacterium]
MLPRILEPEVMDTAQEAVEYNTMDHSAVNRVFVDDLLRLVNKAARVLDVGAGTALIPIELCRRGKEWHVVAVDLAKAMLDVAAKNVGAARLDQAIELKLVDAKRLPFEDGAFRVVMSNSIIHHIPDPADCLAEMARVISPNGGLLFVRDLLRPADKLQLQHLVQTYAGDSDAHQQKMFAESLHAALTLDEIRALAARFGIGADCIQQTTDRHWTLAWRR